MKCSMFILRAIIENLRAEISWFKMLQALFGPKKYDEEISGEQPVTVGRRHYSVLFSLYYTWRNGVRLYNRMILAIIIIMLPFETVGFLVATLQCQWHCLAANQNSRASNDNNALKMNVIFTFHLSPFYANVPFLYPVNVFGFLTFSRGIEMEKGNFL